MKWISRVPLSIKKAKIRVKAFINKDLKACKIKGYGSTALTNHSYLEEKVSYGGIEQRWLLVESAERKKADLNKLDKKIQEELLKANKQIAKLEQEEFTDKSLTELKVKEITTKLKYHQISDPRITETNKGKTTVYRVKCKLRETGLTQKGTKVGVIHELPLRKNKVFSHILRKS
ncbi:transposase [Sphaerospermopsis reniformis]|uniref:Transposase n=1 Tax=Sphaerospermopsis reniformis TaxID=531300 RepID=A0A479ZX92_9CYAN|nr:transposase [Sphaerospermopsis reniformis]